MKPIGLSLVLLAGLAAVSAAEPVPMQPVTVGADSDVEVRLVELDVRVTDREGLPLLGLGPEHFRLEVDGEEVPIEHFSVVGEVAGAAGPDDGQASGTIPRTAAPRVPAPAVASDDASGSGSRQLIVYLDQRFLDTAELASAREQLLEFLRRDVPAGTRVMLASADQELRVVQGFTSEPALVADALQGLEIADGRGAWRTQFDLAMQEVQRYHDMGSAASGDVIPPLRERRGDWDWTAANYRYGSREPSSTSNELDGFIILNQDENKGRHELVETDPRFSLQVVESFGQSIEAGLQASAAHLARLLSAASGLPGETSVLYVGGTLPVNATRTLFELWQDTYGSLVEDPGYVGKRARDRGWASGVLAAGVDGGARFAAAIERLEQVADVASLAGVTVHTLDVSVAGRLGRLGGDAENFRSGSSLRGGGSSDTSLAARSDSGAYVLAERTGGRTEANRRFEDFFTGLSGDLRSAYTLAFPLTPTADPSDPEAAPATHDVKVTLRPGAPDGRLQYRRKVAVKSVEQELVERTVSALAMNLGLSNPLGIEVAAGAPRVDEAGQLRVPLSVKVPMSQLALVPDRQAHAGRLSIYVAVGGLERGVGLEKAVVPVRIANRDLLTAFGRTVDYRLEVSAPARAERLAVTVRDDFRPARSTVLSAIETWDAAADPLPVSETGTGEAEGPL